MNTDTLKSLHSIYKQTAAIPQTARGRAMYATDSFLNGKPLMLNHDNPHLEIRRLFA